MRNILWMNNNQSWKRSLKQTNKQTWVTTVLRSKSSDDEKGAAIWMPRRPGDEVLFSVYVSLNHSDFSLTSSNPSLINVRWLPMYPSLPRLFLSSCEKLQSLRISSCNYVRQISFDHSLKKGKPGRDFYNNNTYCLAMQTFFSINTASYH